MIRIPKRLAAITAFAASAEHARFNTTGVLVRETDNGFYLFATDGRVAGLVRHGEGNLPASYGLASVCSDASEIVLSADDLKRVLKGLPKDAPYFESVDMVLTAGGAEVRYGHARETLKPLEGRYPDVNHLLRISGGQVGSVRLDLDMLIESLRAIKAMIVGDFPRAVTLHFSGAERPVVLTAADGEVQFEGCLVPLAIPKPEPAKPRLATAT